MYQMANTLTEDQWTLLLMRIKRGECTPFLGAGACYETLPLGSEIAEEWAKKWEYPLQNKSDLVEVAQFLAMRFDSVFPKQAIIERFKGLGPPDFAAPDEPHALLADLPLPLYMTTNYDDFMVQALKKRKRDPKQELCRWNKRVENQPSVLYSDPSFTPTVANPIVFHLHGHLGVEDSIVLTEDDYLDFLVNISANKDVLPLSIQAAFPKKTLLFLGYRIADWDFRVLYRSLVQYFELSGQRRHISVQLVPGVGKISDENKVKAEAHLSHYFDGLNIAVYWGTCREFALELRNRWEGVGT
jgi:hypothetical protein